MKRICSYCLIGLLLILFSGRLSAQTKDGELLLTTNHTHIGLSTTILRDDYISDLTYQGMGLQLENTGRRLLNLNHPEWSLISLLDARIGITENSPQTSYISYSGARLGIGTQKRLFQKYGFTVLFGGLWDAGFNYRSSNHEINNFANADLSTNLNLAMSCWYVLKGGPHPVRLSLDVSTPILGGMFKPQRGASFYEILVLENFDNVFHFTSLHNVNALQTHFLVQIPMKRLRLELGMHYDITKVALSNAFFKQETWNMQAGIGYDFHLFGGAKNRAPSIMKSAEDYE